MTKHKKHHRIIATVFLLIFFPTLVPNNLFASNNGPVAPEATSFEPVDATDMVNLASGDMSYVLPLLNVPSPEGGYPLALSNHAGIAVDQEASWVGLGWSLNPGAINRSITGIPDDWKNISTNQIVYDAGGVATTYSAGVSVGWGEGAYSVGLYGSYSENKTFGGTTTYSNDLGVNANIGGVTIGLGTDGASLGTRSYDKHMSNSLSINQSFKGYGTSVSRNLNVNGVGVGASFDSKNKLSSSVSVVGSSTSSNSYSKGALNVRTQSYQISIPIYVVNVSLGFSKARYWTYENNFTKYNGSLYAGDMVGLYNNDPFPNTLAFDSYNSIYKLKSDEQLDGDNLSNIAYDNYSASGQGMSGSFKPALFEQGSLLSNFKDGSTNKSVVSYKNGVNDSFTKTIDNNLNDIHFYFDNEPSSFLKVSSGDWSILTDPALPIEQISPPKPSSIQNGATTIEGVTYNGYNSSAKRKRTGSYIETFTNQEITTNSTIIINPENYNRTTAPIEGIGAFRITALDGKVYHYSLPVYQKEQFAKSTDLTSAFNNRYYEKQQLNQYATHWLLTAITGPDYVDVNLNNKVDQADYGYWTSFDYGKWSDGYVWSTPVKSNDKTKSYEWGVKEIYYLDKIKTRTHTALFIKEERQDNLSYSLQVGNNENDLAWIDKVSRSFVQNRNDNWWYYNGIYNNNIAVKALSPAYSILDGSYGQFIKFNTHKTLKLSKILLLKNEDMSLLKNTGQSPVSNFKGQIKFEQHFIEYNVSNAQTLQNIKVVPYNKTWYGEFYNDVYDTGDVTPLLLQKAIKTVKFNYNSTNPLAKNSTNSSAPLKGRLTLDSVDFLGKNNAQVIPPYKFGYVNDVSYNSILEDNWGYYINKPDAWSLNKITTPTGAQLNIVYESDDIDKEAVSGMRGFDSSLQFTFSNFNNKLRINVENESGANNNVNFEDFFQVGTTTLDLWASYRRDYNVFLEGCKSRKGSIDVNTNVQVVSVTPTNVVLETSWASCWDDNGGLGEMFKNIVGLKNHPNTIIEKYDRGEWSNPPGCAGTPTARLVLKYSLYGKKNIPIADKSGGGIRVKEISINEGSIKKNNIRYFYNMPNFGESKTDANYKSSGITSFVPQKYFKEIKYISELPSPSVMYEYVTVKNYSENNSLGVIEQYNFNVLKPDISTSDDNLILPDILEITKAQTLAVSGTNNINYSHYNIKDLTSTLGRLKQKKVFNSSLQLISNEQYNFKNIIDIKQGISEESFNTYKRVNKGGIINYRLGVTSKIKYPSFLESFTTTQGGYTNTNYFDKHDFLTGEVLESHTVSSDGQSFKTKVVPAYIKYPQMGSKADNINNKNMLSQTAANYFYILDKSTSTWKETGVGITTWSNIWTYKDITGTSATPSPANEKIWRKHKSYVWNGLKDNDGIFTNYNSTNNSDDGFDWTVGVGSQPAQWKQTSEVTLYDHYSAPLEMKDINSNYASTKMGDKDSKVMATGNAGYSEMFYAGAENLTPTTTWLEPEVSVTSASQQNGTYFHTGKKSVATTSSSQFGVAMQNGQHRAGKYKVSVWVKKDNVAKAQLKVNGLVIPFVADNIVAANWQLKTAYIDVPIGSCSVYLNSSDTSTVYYDDLMVRPVASSITGYVYNEWDELTHIIGNNGLATRFEYDPAGRLTKTSAEVVDDNLNGILGGFKTIKTNVYNNKYLK
jgi:hypothetical protein